MSSTTVDLSQVPYGYIPGTYVAYSMLFAFGSILVIHLFLSIRHRTWFLLPTVAMCVSLELVGGVLGCGHTTNRLCIFHTSHNSRP